MTINTLMTKPVSTTNMTLTNKMQSIYALSLDVASKSNLLFRHGCVATYGGKIIRRGCNTHTYSTDDFIRNSCSCHAEIFVLRYMFQKYKRQHKEEKIRRIFRKTTLYISRLTHSGDSQTSAPCMDCLKIIKSFEIKRIIFYHDGYQCMNPINYMTTHLSYGKIHAQSTQGLMQATTQATTHTSNIR